MSTAFALEKVDTSLSLKEKAYAAIKDAILTLRLEPGIPLVESDLAGQLGISKTPIRDALQELEREGFVARVPFRGTYVTEVTVKDITEVFQLRAVLEGLAVHLAVEFITDQELDQLAAELAAAEIALNEGNTLLCSEKSRRIHRTLVDQAHNERLALLIRNLDDHVQRFRVLSDRISGRLGKSLQQHHRVLEALRQRNAGEAEEAMREHLLSVLQDLTAAGD